MSADSGVVFFAHGKETGPHGRKIQVLGEVARARGYRTQSPDYAGMMDPEERVEKLLRLAPSDDDQLVLVGSSMGGYVSTVASAKLAPRGLFLLAPAFFVPGYAQPSPPPQAGAVTIVHGWNDDVVPVDHSIRFAREHRAMLHLVDDDHRLSGDLQLLSTLFALFLDRLSGQSGA